MSPLPEDPVALAVHLMASGRLRREASLVSLQQIVGMSRRLVALDDIANAAADYLLARQADLDWSETSIAPAQLPEANAAEAAFAAAHDKLAGALAALGYVTLKAPDQKEECDGQHA